MRFNLISNPRPGDHLIKTINIIMFSLVCSVSSSIYNKIHSENGYQIRCNTDPVTQLEYGLRTASRIAREVTGSVIS